MIKNYSIAADGKSRADKLLKKEFPHLGSKEIEWLFDEKRVTSAGRACRKGDRITDNAEVMLHISQAEGKIRRSVNLPEVIYEDDELFVCVKPAGIHTVAHRFIDDDTLVNRAAAYLADKNQFADDLDGGSLNRLDEPTTGLVLFAKNKKAHDFLRSEMDGGRIEKYYFAEVIAEIDDVLRMEDNIEGRQAVSEAVKFKRKSRTSLLWIRLFTGVRHQLRRQLSLRGLPICGDSLYGGAAGEMHLHSAMLVFQHPSKDFKLTLFAPAPLWVNA